MTVLDLWEGPRSPLWTLKELIDKEVTVNHPHPVWLLSTSGSFTE